MDLCPEVESHRNSDVAHSSYDSTRLTSDSDREPTHCRNTERSELSRGCNSGVLANITNLKAILKEELQALGRREFYQSYYAWE